MSRCDTCNKGCDSTCRQPSLWEQGNMGEGLKRAFAAARATRIKPNNTCDKCGQTNDGVGWFAAAFRKSQIKRGYPDPGNPCGNCAGGITGPRIADEALKAEKR